MNPLSSTTGDSKGGKPRPSGLRRRLLGLCLTAGALSGCGTAYTPVERHFVRVPARLAGYLSGIERADWMDRARANSEALRMAREGQYVYLPPELGPPQAEGRSVEIKFFPDAGGRDGVLALHWFGSGSGGAAEKLSLLKVEASGYSDASQGMLSKAAREAAAFRLSPLADTLVCIPRAGTGAPLTFRWNGSGLAPR